MTPHRTAPLRPALAAAEGVDRGDLLAALGRATLAGQRAVVVALPSERPRLFETLPERPSAPLVIRFDVVERRGDVFVWDARLEGEPRSLDERLRAARERRAREQGQR